MNLLFVCTGNTCRSPIAEVVARAMAESRGRTDVSCASAGTFAFPGNPAAGPGIAVAEAHDLDLTKHASSELSLELAEWADVIFAMDMSHAEMAVRLSPETPVHLMTDFLPQNHAIRGAGVPDPYGGDLDTYRATYELLELAMRGVFDALPDAPPDESREGDTGSEGAS